MCREGTTVQYGVRWTTELPPVLLLLTERRCTITWVALLPCGWSRRAAAATAAALSRALVAAVRCRGSVTYVQTVNNNI